MRYLKIIIGVLLALLLITGVTSTAAAHGPIGRYPRFEPGFYHFPPRFYHFPPQRSVPRYSLPATSIYIVKPGDTLFRIARRFGAPIGALLAANPQIRNPNLIFRGQRLFIPGRYGAPGQPGYGGAYGYDGGYGGGAYNGKDTTGQPPPMETIRQTQVAMQNITFQPGEIRVNVETTVTWTNRDGFAHTVTAGTRSNPSGLFDSGNVGGGGVFSFTFQEPGTYNYFCSIHPGMDGVVIVEAASQQQMPPQQAPSYGGGYGGGNY